MVIPVHDVLWGYAFLARLNGDGHAMLVGAADEKNFFAVVAQIAGVNVGRNIDTGKVADVNGSIGIRKSGSNRVSFRIIHIFRVF